MTRLMTPVLALLCLPLAAMAQTDTPDVIGVWLTPLAPQTAGAATAYVRERLEFGATTNTISIEAFADEAAEVPLFTYASSGPYRIEGPSPVVAGAYLLDAENEMTTVTIFADAPDLWAALNLDACPLEIGVAVPIKDCVTGPPLNAAQCVEMDLVAVSEDGLRLAARDTDRCVERPDSMGDTLYIRP